MRMPSLCPFCQDPMVNTFEAIWEVLHKTCHTKLNHKIEFTAALPDNDRVDQIEIKVDHYTMAIWSLERKVFRIESDRVPSIDLPYFEPDLSNHRKLMEKIKTYLIFS